MAETVGDSSNTQTLPLFLHCHHYETTKAKPHFPRLLFSWKGHLIAQWPVALLLPLHHILNTDRTDAKRTHRMAGPIPGTTSPPLDFLLQEANRPLNYVIGGYFVTFGLKHF